MRTAFLHLDDALEQQPTLLSSGGAEIEAIDLGPRLRLWSRPAGLIRLEERLRRRLPNSPGAELVFAGSGDFHHITPILVKRTLERIRGPLTLIHFDNHPDWVRFERGVHCGSWVNGAAALPGVAKVLTVGVCSRDIDQPERRGAELSLVRDERVELYPWRAPDGQGSVTFCGREWPTVEALGEAAFIDLLVSRIPAGPVYVTIDKDVLRAEDAATNWDQGQASLSFLSTAIVRIAEAHKLVGADVVGDYSPPVFGGPFWDWALKSGEAFLDHPRGAAPAAVLNERVNLSLLALFREAMQ